MPEPAVPAIADAYLQWGLATGFKFAYLGRRDRVGLLVVWSSAESARAAAALWVEVRREGLKFDVPRVYLKGSDPRHRRPSTVWTLSIRSCDVEWFLREFGPLATRVELAAAIAPPPKSQPRAAARRQQSQGPVLLAVIDDGCAFANARFLAAGLPRVIWLWDQNTDSPGAPLTGTNGPSSACNFGYGGQWSNADLVQLLQDEQGSAERSYAAARLEGLRRRAVHGTHLMDLLAGGMDDWELVFVQFPKEAVDDPSGSWLDKYAGEALRYVVECAGPKTGSIVVNLSWGPQTGPHDGSRALERLIDELVDEQAAFGRKLEVCLPAGNSFASRAHAEIAHRTGGEVRWVVPPDGKRPQFLEVWWPPGFPPAKVKLHVTPPASTAIDIVNTAPPDQTTHWQLDVLDGSPRLLLVVHPTEHPDPAWRGRHGTWTIAVGASGVHGYVKPVHVYVARADHNMGARRRAKASYLTDGPLEAARFVKPDVRDDEASASAIRRAGTLNGIATGMNAHVVSGYRFSDRKPAPYSSSGPTRGGRVGPDHACVTDRSPVLPGLRASGVRTGTSVTVVGTSTAAPQYGHLIALKAANLPPPPTTQPPGPLPVPPPSPQPDPRVGFGTIDPRADLIHPR